MKKIMTVYRVENGYLLKTAEGKFFIGLTEEMALHAARAEDRKNIPFVDMLTDEQFGHVKEEIKDSFINAIKLVRAYTDLPLRDAKDLCDALRSKANQ